MADDTLKLLEHELKKAGHSPSQISTAARCLCRVIDILMYQQNRAYADLRDEYKQLSSQLFRMKTREDGA